MMLYLMLMLTSPASAGEVATEPDTSGIVQIPEETTITLPGKKPFQVKQFSYLLPESYYDKALISAKKLAICEPALDASAARVEKWVEVSDKALEACSGQFDVDEATIETLRSQVGTMEARALAAETRLHDVRTQRNTAWAITGGLVLGAVAVTAVAIGG